MSDDLHDLFRHAAKYFYKEYKTQGGSQGDLAEKLGITQSYLSAVINGSRTASLELQNKIAKILYGPYDKLLKVGRRIMEGLDPIEEKKPEPFDNVENLIARLTHYVMEQQLIEKRLRISEEKFKDISLTSGDMIFELDKDMRFTYVSGKVREVTGLAETDLLGKKPYDFIDDEESARIKPLIEEAIRSKTIFDTVLHIKRDDEDFYRHIISTPILSDVTGEFIGARGTYRDITKRKKLEKIFDEQVWLFQAAIDSITDKAVVITDKGNKVLNWNRTYQELVGYPDEILATRNLLKYFAYLKENNLLADPEDFTKGIEEVKNSKEEIVQTFDFADGRTIRRRTTPIFRDGNFAGRVSFLTDITKKKKISAKISKGKATKKKRSKS
jgi:PAS domain S-box-containing protein